MKSLKDLYKTGIGPSSSHTMGPVKAAEYFLKKHSQLQSFRAILFGSLAMTGKGHGTDRALLAFFEQHGKILKVEFDKQTRARHPNTFIIEGIDDCGNIVALDEFYSIGGGEIEIKGVKRKRKKEDVYPLRSFSQIKQYCTQNNLRLWEYALQCEGESILPYLADIYDTMGQSMKEGLSQKGVLEGGLKVKRRAAFLVRFPNAEASNRHLFAEGCDFDNPTALQQMGGFQLASENIQTYENRIVSAFAFAVSESNASGAKIVTAPTCGACGVLPAAFKYFELKDNLPQQTILKGLLTAGIVGNLVKHNASISGAECGCQAEIGTACAMTAAGLAEMLNFSIDEIEFSAEVALEHHLGLTCDPIDGLVQIPCIERNAVASMRAINAVSLATFLSDSRRIPLDTAIRTMYETGKDLHSGYRETAKKGLAKNFLDPREN